MKHIKLIGLISSIILIINFIIIGPVNTFNFNENWFDTLNHIHRTFIFPSAFIGFYFALYKLVQKFEIKKFTIPVAIILCLGVINWILNFSRFLGINSPDILHGLPSTAMMIVFIVWAILAIKNKEDGFKRIRNFATSMLVGYAVTLIFTTVSLFARSFFYEAGYYPLEYTNVIYAVYGIGYVFGLLIFVDKLKNTNS